ncbi:hypothetical protein HDU91_006735 [Kappamyces sp. JEL0680]|nr:hypothetical protein HDU91_006735 [Kappamyces sp. JEL0680]
METEPPKAKKQKAPSLDILNLTKMGNALPSDIQKDRPIRAAKSRLKKDPAPRAVDSPPHQGFAHIMTNKLATFTFSPTFSTDPLQCNENLENPAPLPLEQDLECTQVMTPLVPTSVAATGFTTPTKPQAVRSTEEVLNKVSETLLLEISNSTLGLMVDAKPAFGLGDQLPCKDQPTFRAAFDMWLDDIKTEEVVAQFTSPECLDRQKDISPLNRWMVCVEHRMTRQTFHSAIQYLDIFLTNFDFGQDNVQLIGVAALLVSLKINETNHYPVAFLVEFMWDEEAMSPEENQRNLEQAKRFLLKYECKLMKLMKWNVMLPTSIDFLRHSLQFAMLFEGKTCSERLSAPLYDSRDERGNDTVFHQKFDTLLFAQAAAILDKAAIDYHSLPFLGSQLAAAAFWMVYPKDGSSGACWQLTLEYQEQLLLAATGYSLDQLGECFQFLDNYFSSPEDVYSILDCEMMQEVIQKHASEDIDFKLEEHQIPCLMSAADYGTRESKLTLDNVLAERATKAGASHVLSAWMYS